MSGNFRSMQGVRREDVLAAALGILLLACTLLTGGANAATLGKLTVSSTLGQPFRGEIEVAEQPRQPGRARAAAATRRYRMLGAEVGGDLGRPLGHSVELGLHC